MFKKYDPQFKYCVVIAALNGTSLDEINKSYSSSVSKDSLYRWTKLYTETRAVVCDPNLYKTQGQPLSLSEDEQNFIKEMVQENPSLYLTEIQERLQSEHKIQISCSTISSALHRHLGMSQKTLRKVHPNQDQMKRARYIAHMAHIDPHCLVFTDECGICLDGISRNKGWAPVGQRTPRVATQRATHRFNLIPAVSMRGLVAVMVQQETVNRFDFEFFLERILLPMMNPFPGPQSILVLDNAPIHRGGRVEEIGNSKGIRIFYLPPYSPDMNPIEKAFGILKATLRRCGPLTGGEDDGDIIETYTRCVFTSHLMKKLFRACGYVP